MENNCSAKWKKRGTRQGLLRNALLKTMGYTDEDIEKPLIGVINTWSETNPGHYNFRELAEAVKRGVWAAGGFPLEMNTMSICEVFFDISSMVYRNLLSMTTEELIARQPFDGIVLMGSCDKNVPAQVMAAVSANKPMIYLPGGPMLPGNFQGESLACGTDSFKLWEKYTSGEMSLDDVSKREGCLYGSVGACPIMGTANTCQTVVEALGLALPYSASSLAVSSEKLRIAEMTGRRIVGLVEKGVKPLDIVTKRSVTNAIKVLMAAGGSTNLLIHLKAICRRAGIPLDLMEFDAISRQTPLPVSGKAVAGNLAEVDYAYDREVIRPLSNPISPTGGIAVLKGNLAPGGAVIKRSAASPNLLRHTGEARVFDDLAVAEKYLLDDNSDMDENKVIVLRGYGPKGAPGMPEFGNYMPIPPKLSRRGIHDYVRITDSRMSGGAFGTVVLHVSPESAAGGPLAAVRDGDTITLDVEKNLIQLNVPDAEIAERLKGAKLKDHPDITRGFVRNFIDNVLQADEGCDLKYL